MRVVLAVHGNMDAPQANESLPTLNSLKIFDWKIGVIHDPYALAVGTRCVTFAEENGFKRVGLWSHA